jgi:Ca2+-transporting ATPase
MVSMVTKVGAREEPKSQNIQNLPVRQVYSALASRPEGLSQTEAELRLQQFGLNTLKEVRGAPLYRRFLANFTHPMAILLWIGGIVGYFAQMPQLAVAVWMVNIINGAFSFWQEFQAEKATAALRKLLPSFVRVMRDGQEQRIEAEKLVPGDVVWLSEGDKISADCRLVQVAELRVDQSTLTGESNPITKTEQPVRGNGMAKNEIPNLVFAGTSVAAGSAKCVVTATGMNTEFGKIARLTQTVGAELSPLQKEMDNVTRIVTIFALAVGVVFFLMAMFFAHITFAESFIFALGMIVAFVPEGLLPTVTLALAIGTQRMAKRHALIKKLSAVETLGCTTVICTDKTGTLTQNEMTVSDLWLGGQQYSITGIGYAPIGNINLKNTTQSQVKGTLSPEGLDDDLSSFLRAALLCNNSRLLPPNGETSRWSILGDPTEAALKVAAMKGKLEPEREEEMYPRWREIPFDSRRKRMSTVHNLQNGQRIAFIKGAPKEVLELCSTILYKGEEQALTDDLRADIMDANDDYARSGLRVLAIARRCLPINFVQYRAETVEQDLVFLGLIAMMDPPRAEVAQAVKKCRQAGIRVIMITGDYGLTAESIARKTGIVRGKHPRIIAGTELENMEETGLEDALKEEVIFARVAPEHKLRVVSTLQRMSQIVAVTGDGVNDAPALKKADIGVAMGLTGTDVAKEAADMILTDDNFASIVNAVEEGRAVYSNIKKFTSYIFTSNTPEAIPFIIFAFSGGLIPPALSVMTVLSVDLGTDLVPALALGAEPPEPGVMDHPPRSLKEHVINGALFLRAYIYLGLPQSALTMLAFFLMYWLNGYAGQWTGLPGSGPLYASATAISLAAVVFTQIGNLFAQRTERTSVIKTPLFNNKMLWIGIASELIIVFSIVYLPFMHTFIGTNSFPLQYWLYLIAFIPVLPLVDEIRKYFLRSQDK